MLWVDTLMAMVLYGMMQLRTPEQLIASAGMLMQLLETVAGNMHAALQDVWHGLCDT